MKINIKKISPGILVFPVSAYLCGLRGIWLIPSVLSVVWMVPVISWSRIRSEEQTAKTDNGIYYMEQMLYSFGKNRKILATLRDTEELCEGRLKENVHEASERLNRGEYGMFRAAFSVIETEYGSRLMRNMHNFLIGAEEQGGEVGTAIHLLDSQLNNCKTEEKSFRLRMEGVRKKLLLSVLLSCFICVASARLVPSWVSLYDSMIFKSALMLGICVLQILYAIFSCIPWPDITEAGTSFKKDGDSRSYQGNSAGRHKRAFVQKKNRSGKADRTLTAKRNKSKGNLKNSRIESKKRKAELERAFPVWMYEMLLRIQTESVDSAVLHSIETAAPVLAKPLYRLYNEITENPVSADPYKNFLCEYQLEQVRAMMMRLYAVSTMGKDEIPVQIALILKQNQALKETADNEHAENLLTAAGFLTALPMTVSFLVLTVTMSVMMLTVLKTFTISI